MSTLATQLIDQFMVGEHAKLENENEEEVVASDESQVLGM